MLLRCVLIVFTERYISSLSSPQASESGRALAADLYTVLVPLKVMVQVVMPPYG